MHRLVRWNWEVTSLMEERPREGDWGLLKERDSTVTIFRRHTGEWVTYAKDGKLWSAAIPWDVIEAANLLAGKECYCVPL